MKRSYPARWASSQTARTSHRHVSVDIGSSGEDSREPSLDWWKHMTSHGTSQSPLREIWPWPLLVLVAFPFGGLVADLIVDGVDSLGAALVAGLTAGALIGVAEWFALRHWVSWQWIPATAGGMAVGLSIGAMLVDYGVSRADLVVMGAITGAGVGVAQLVVLMRSTVRPVSNAYWWALANPPAWALGWFISTYVITKNVADQWANFGASGTLAFGILTWLLLAVLFRTKVPTEAGQTTEVLR